MEAFRQEMEIHKAIRTIGVRNPELVRSAVMRDSRKREEAATFENKRLLKEHLYGVLKGMGLKNFPVTIHGEHGMVTYDTLKDHPKVESDKRKRRVRELYV